MEITPNGLSIIASEALYQINNNIKDGKISGSLDIDAKGLMDSGHMIDGDCAKAFNVSVEVSAKELEFDFDKFSNEIIIPAAMHIVEKLNALRGKYVSPNVLNFSDSDKMTSCQNVKGVSIEASYGYDSDSHKNILSLYVMVVQKQSPKVFLGGTCNGSLWRGSMQDKLKIDSFNPVVKDWTEECMAEEIKQREECDFCLYVITPRMTGTYSIAEAVDDSNKRPEKTIFAIAQYDESFEGDECDQISYEDHVIKSLVQVGKMVESNGAKFFTNLNDVVEYLNGSE